MSETKDFDSLASTGRIERISATASINAGKDAALMKNGAASPNAAIATPPTTGPTSIIPRPAVAFMVTASGSTDSGTSLGKSACRAPPSNASVAAW